MSVSQGGHTLANAQIADGVFGELVEAMEQLDWGPMVRLADGDANPLRRRS